MKCMRVESWHSKAGTPNLSHDVFTEIERKKYPIHAVPILVSTIPNPKSATRTQELNVANAIPHWQGSMEKFEHRGETSKNYLSLKRRSSNDTNPLCDWGQREEPARLCLYLRAPYNMINIVTKRVYYNQPTRKYGCDYRGSQDTTGL